MEGMTQPEAAARLCVSEGAIRGRLARARASLRDRLTRRGLAPAIATTIPPAWIAATVTAAREMVSRGTSSVAAPASVAIKHAAALLVALGVVLVAATGGVTATPPSPPPRAPSPPPPPPQNVGHEPAAVTKPRPGAPAGRWSSAAGCSARTADPSRGRDSG